MKFIADIHIHSYYSRATSKKLNLEHLDKWAQLKGLGVVATGDITHPKWLEEMRQKLVPTRPGLYGLKSEYADELRDEIYPVCESEVSFLLSGEISTIYKKGDKVRKVHNVAFLPSLESVERLQARLDKIGNIRSDGRPILGLDSRDLLELLLEVDERAKLIPAHIWTPWFSMLGSKSGFDSVEECFEDLTPHIFALETGLSSDPPMNWRLSMLDRYTLVSNSDAHSPEKLAREANLFDTDLSYEGMFTSLEKSSEGFIGTIEFFPEEGKYHMDGHRSCKTMLRPSETITRNGLCPRCGKPVTLGVSYRVEELADRPEGAKPESAKPFYSLVPLPEVLSEVEGVGPNSKRVQKRYHNMLQQLGPELKILMDLSLTEIEKSSGNLVAEAVRRMREGEVNPQPGYDGEFGIIRIFSDEERQKIARQGTLFAIPKVEEKVAGKPVPATDVQLQKVVKEKTEQFYGLNERQQEAVDYDGPALIIQAGPGTGKTRTLTHRIAAMLEKRRCEPENILAVTFTNKAADEMKERLQNLLGGESADRMTISTFHAFGLQLMRRHPDLLPGRFGQFSIIQSDDIRLAYTKAPGAKSKFSRTVLDKISWCKSQMFFPDNIAAVEKNDFPADFEETYREYEQLLVEHNMFDFDDLILVPLCMLRNNPNLRRELLARYTTIFVDEFQDINRSQYELFKIFAIAAGHCCVIGDPDQAIYGFRGASHEFFLRFQKDFPQAKLLRLEQSYRSPKNVIAASRQMLSTKNLDAEQLWSDIAPDVKVAIRENPTDRAEAEFIVHQIEKMVGGTSHFSIDSKRVDDDDAGEFGFGDFVILVRSRNLLPTIEEALSRSGIPYSSIENDLLLEDFIVGLVHQTLDHFCRHKELFLPEPGVFDSEKEKSTDEELQDANVSSLVEKAADHWITTYSTERGGWLKKQLLELAAPFGDRLQEFLDALALRRQMDISRPADRVSIMTLHASKGLEFPVVFIPGCEENIIPNTFPGKKADVEEERRLFYVGMTRAKRHLFLSHAKVRYLFGLRHSQKPSHFLQPISESLLNRLQADEFARRRDSDQLSLF